MPKQQDKSIKLRKSQSHRTLREDGVWVYLADHDPMEVLNTPEYFDEIATDLIDPEKYFSTPLSSGIGTKFAMILGDPLKNHYRGDFEVDGLVKTVNEHGIPLYRLLWSQLGKWRVLDMEKRIAESASGNDKKQDVRKVA